MNILVIGGGGREHALAWILSRDRRRPRLFCAPGNAGTAAIGVNLPIGAEDLDGLERWAAEHRPDLTVVGPEAPLCAGLVDRLEAAGLRVFGPNRAAARLEGSKTFAKDVMRSAGVPTAWAQSFTDFDAARACVRERGAPIVIKADGLAAGKGVSVCATVAEAESALHDILVGRVFGDSGVPVVVEECLTGEEASILGLVDGERVVLLASAQDHKRALDGDRGPNTGGMGAYSPAPVVTEALCPRIREEVFGRTLRELRNRGIRFKGVLYAGLMIGKDGVPRVLEFNVRFGDPETQCVLPRFTGDIIGVFEACIDGTLSDEMVQWTDDPCVCVVMAAGGYPGRYGKGDAIAGLDVVGGMEGVTVFHAGTALSGEQVVTAGGRVLGVTATGRDLPMAIARAYEGAAKISWADCRYRTDIGARALSRREKP